MPWAIIILNDLNLHITECTINKLNAQRRIYVILGYFPFNQWPKIPSLTFEADEQPAQIAAHTAYCIQ